VRNRVDTMMRTRTRGTTSAAHLNRRPVCRFVSWKDMGWTAGESFRQVPAMRESGDGDEARTEIFDGEGT